MHGPTFLSHLGGGAAPRAVWNAAPGDDWPTMLAHAVAATLRERARVADLRARPARRAAGLERPRRASSAPTSTSCCPPRPGRQSATASSWRCPAGRARSSSAPAPPRWRPCTTSACVVIWDDGDDLHAEPRAPYPHVREVLAMRATQQGAAMLVGRVRPHLRERCCCSGPGGRTSWPPTARSSARGPGSTSVPGRGPSRRFAHPAGGLRRDPRGTGERPGARPDPARGLCPLARLRALPHAGAVHRPVPGRSCWAAPRTPPTCRWCGTADPAWACRECGHRGLRAPVRGEARTAEELGRSFAGTTIRSSSSDRVLTQVSDQADIVVATVGAEPPAEGGYAAVVILDTWLTLARDDLRANEEALRRWLGAAGTRAAGRSGRGGRRPGLPVLQALVRWDPAGFAERELAERTATHLPPAARLATITGEPGALDDALTLLDLPEVADLLGPVAGRGREGRAARRHPGAARLRAGPLRCPGRAPAGAERPQARRRTHPGRPAGDLDSTHVRIGHPGARLLVDPDGESRTGLSPL